MKVFVTGGSGFIGIPLVQKLAGGGHSILVYDAFPRLEALSRIEGVEVVRGDVSNWSEVYDAVRSFRPDGIIHLAAMISQHAEEHPLQAFEINIDGTVAVFEVARKVGIKKIAFPSTVATFSSGVSSPIHDDEIQQPKTVYGISKVFCELWGTYCSEKYGMDFRSVRLPSIIGLGRTNGGVSVYASLMIERPARGLSYEVQAGPDSSIPLLYIKDAVNAVASLFEAKSLTRRVYNASGVTPMASQILNEVKKHVSDAKVTFASNPRVVAMLKEWQQMDSSNFERDTGWRISYPLAKLVSDFISEVTKEERRAPETLPAERIHS
jgi:nucleoside-diphosphate-sugar epimerase